jgi:DNA-3-methyladenine glycosylase II
MWFEKPPCGPDWAPAIRYLRRNDPILRPVIDRVGPCTLHPRRDYFVVLCKAIFTQQISTAVATILFGRFRDLFPRRRPTPKLVLDALDNRGADVLRKCGLSRQKAVYLRDLSRHFLDGRIPTRRLGRMTDEAVIESLVGVKGIGRWTAEMFLIFTLNRPDVLPVDDLGLKEGVREVFGMSERPDAKTLEAIGEAWTPYRSIATWYLWRRGTTTPAADQARGLQSPGLVRRNSTAPLTPRRPVLPGRSGGRPVRNVR